MDDTSKSEEPQNKEVDKKKDLISSCKEFIDKHREGLHMVFPYLVGSLTFFIAYHIHTVGCHGEVTWGFQLPISLLVIGVTFCCTLAKTRCGWTNKVCNWAIVGWAVIIILIADSLPRSFDTSDGQDRYFYVEIITGEYEGQNMAGRGISMQLLGKNTALDTNNYDLNISEIFSFSSSLSYFVPGCKRSFYVTTNFTELTQLKVWIDRKGDDRDPTWFLETVSCAPHDANDGNKTIFPFHRWLTTKSEVIQARDAILPQKDSNAQKRHEGILAARTKYQFMDNAGGIQVTTTLKTTSEAFSPSYHLRIFVMKGLLNTIKEKILSWITWPWQSLQETTNIYDVPRLNFPAPECVDQYSEVFEAMANGNFDQTKLDKLFGQQRLTGANPAVIERVRSVDEITDRMWVRANQKSNHTSKLEDLDGLLSRHLEDLKLEEAVQQKRLYKVDYTEILLDLPYQTEPIASPIALFFVDKNQNLMPVAIQLFKKRRQNSMGSDNPIFLPDDDTYTWLLAKMWFNNADASYHQSASHLGFTHLLMESMYIALHRSVSMSHPLLRLMAPHFLYLNNINVQAWETLISKGGWVDNSMSVGVKGMLEIIRRKMEGSETIKPWRLNVEGNIENDIVARGVEDLPKYTFRDDALKVFKIIKKYVTHAIEHTYKDIKDLHDDHEIQGWGELLLKESDDGGCGMKGLPFNATEGKYGEIMYFNTNDELINTITSVIYICSAGHASVNFRQYQEYGYPLNYPGMLYGDPPRNKKEKKTEQDILAALPTVKQTLTAMTMTDILSQRGANKLGHFEKQYQFKNDGTEPLNVERFKKELEIFSSEIRARNDDNSDDTYDVLDPEFIPNSISI